MLPLNAMNAGKYNPERGVRMPAIVQPKLDGWRVVWKDGALFTRSNKRLTNPPRVIAALKTYFADFVLDGELVGESFRSIASTAGTRTRTVDDPQAHFKAFDVLRYDDEEAMGYPLRKRLILLSDIFAHAGQPADCPVSLLEWQVIEPGTDPVELAYGYKLRGQEGGMVKYLHATYQPGLRPLSGVWEKIKFDKEVDATITGVKPGEASFTGMVGALHVLTDTGIECKVSSGLTHEQRRDFQRRHDAGQLAGVRITCLLADDNSKIDKRFGRFLKEVRERNDL